MREHEVPTHVQAEDRALLWFTFPQVVALMATLAVAYGVYHYLPLGPQALRIAAAAAVAIAGVAAVAVRIGGRPLPLATADLLRFRFGPRRFTGTLAELLADRRPTAEDCDGCELRDRCVRQAGEGSGDQPEPPDIVAFAGCPDEGDGQDVRFHRERRNGRRPFPGWLVRRRKASERRRRERSKEERRDRRHRGPGRGPAVAAALMLVLLAVPQAALAQNAEGGDGPGWSSPEIDFQPPSPVAGRRLFVEELTVSEGTASVKLRAAAPVDLQAAAYGGRTGAAIRFWSGATLEEGERIIYDLPLDGPAPSLSFGWRDARGQAGVLALQGDRLPHALPSAYGELCVLRVTSLTAAPGAVAGSIAADCVESTEEIVELQTVAGHRDVTETALLAATVVSVSGSVAVSSGDASVSVPLVIDGETEFSIAVDKGQVVHPLTITADVTAALSVPLPPLTELIHIPAREEERTETVMLTRPGVSRVVTETVTLSHPDGSTSRHTVSATLSVPSRVVSKQVTITIDHPERIEAETTERSPLSRTRAEELALIAGAWTDDSYEALEVPEPTPTPEPARQTPSGDLGDWFRETGWEWPW